MQICRRISVSSSMATPRRQSTGCEELPSNIRDQSTSDNEDRLL